MASTLQPASNTSTAKSNPNWRGWDSDKKKAFLKRLKAIPSPSTEAEAGGGGRSAAEYIEKRLGYEVWKGDKTSQADIVAHYDLVLRQLHERRDYEQGKKKESDLV